MESNTVFEKLLGTKTLKCKKGVGHQGECDTNSLSSNDVVGLYFSAHWCPPCRGFTPVLAKEYEQMRKDGKKFEIVFVSSDKDQKSFDDYYDDMPWCALPFSERKMKAKLSKKYGVQGIPTLVLLDNQGNVLTKDGRSAITQNPGGYPWPARTLSDMLGTSFVSKEGTVGKEAIEGKYLGLYFSASWCPPCRAFTPVLSKMYTEMKKTRDDFEFIFISGDSDESSFKEYHNKMPFLALPYSESKNNQLLNAHFEVEGIPTLVIVSPDGKTITTDGRSRVASDEEGKEFPFYPKPVNNVDHPDGINDTVSLVILAEGESKSTQEKFEGVLAKLGEEEKERTGGEPEMLFFIGTNAEGVASRLRAMAKLGNVGEGEAKKEVVCDGDECRMVKSGAENTKVVLFDIPDEGGFYVMDGVDASEEGLKGFIKKFQDGGLERQQLGR
uniref:Thioredoxin domain-containing protein n=1 Tax=Paramoeba aestuarina TaxID=180227 RepID=A0A7S4P5Z5_9EUKA|mmetsp:Transcript_36687/g.57610  ORF Transcript_36687/g.57610 Transcript_36687/m.57610 type:complete len:441 (+) Transcript_36687:66-1388(+)|eukprot:CAMPEP_0201523670 /NCGR_PEP_ID=MMETSP0161_2-20130828/20710_1 /ASSEMBLY_ACC=CAM_ASM_000251 /TAXON_ID=180227 /ORGANISM="Neoparamoeba aestuarina, Strain SoJaBio B1-5/56/2" /LENGTH=440 /DNA_ID=CAMNT_0047922855 /DNA_START=71 /DNA_END=1393 /DNA_ORIENTATION=+